MILDNTIRDSRITLAQRDHWQAELAFRPAMILNGAEPSSRGRGVESISVTDRDWKEECERLIGRVFRICGVRTVEQVQFISAFAAAHQMTMEWKEGGFELKPRRFGY